MEEGEKQKWQELTMVYTHGNPKVRWNLNSLCEDTKTLPLLYHFAQASCKESLKTDNQCSACFVPSDVQFKTPILEVLYNTAHKDFTEKKIMVKGTIIEVDGEQFKFW